MNLESLKPRISVFVDFARAFPAPYRPAIVAHLLELDRSERGPSAPNAIVPPPSAAVNPADLVAAGVHPAVAEIAAEIGASAELVNRRLLTVIDGRPEIRWKSDHPSRSKRQIEYAIIFTYVLEKLGEEGAGLEDLRNVCAQKRAYDMANFMANFKRARDVLQFADVPGSREQELVLTGQGRLRAKALLERAGGALPVMVGTAPRMGNDAERNVELTQTAMDFQSPDLDNDQGD